MLRRELKSKVEEKPDPAIESDLTYVRLTQLEQEYLNIGIALEAFQIGKRVFLEVGEGIVIEVTSRHQGLDKKPDEFEVLVVNKFQDPDFAKKMFEGPHKFITDKSDFIAALTFVYRRQF